MRGRHPQKNHLNCNRSSTRGSHRAEPPSIPWQKVLTMLSNNVPAHNRGCLLLLAKSSSGIDLHEVNLFPSPYNKDDLPCLSLVYPDEPKDLAYTGLFTKKIQLVLSHHAFLCHLFFSPSKSKRRIKKKHENQYSTHFCLNVVFQKKNKTSKGKLMQEE